MNLVFYFYVSCFLYNAYEKKQINTLDCQLPGKRKPTAVCSH